MSSQPIFEQNTVDDLRRFLRRRRCLNNTNIALVYCFHFIQAGGILLTSYATSVNDTRLVWVGLLLNVTATLISIYEKTNNNMLQKLLEDIKLIRGGVYIDEGAAVETLNSTGAKRGSIYEVID